MRSLTLALAIVASLALAASARAQITTWTNSPETGPRATSTHVSLFGSFTLPVGSFADTRSADAGFATPGFGGGLDIADVYRSGIEAGGVLLVDRTPTDTEQMREASFGFVSSSSSWVSGWALARFGFETRAHDGAQSFLDVYGGGVYARSPSVTFQFLGTTLQAHGESWIGPAWGAGAGVRLHDRVTLGLLWTAGSLSGTSGDGGRLPISALHATLGYSLMR